jgi:Zn-dependent metalloprotease
MPTNGLRSFALHSADPDVGGPTLAALTAERSSFPSFSPFESIVAQDPESAARDHLRLALASPALPSFSAEAADGSSSEFRLLGTEQIPLTGTTTVKFRQAYRKVPVYGSLVTVELDEGNELVSINSSLGDPTGVDPVASVSPSRVIEIVTALAGQAPELEAVPRLVYYHVQEGGRWHLAYLVEDVVKSESKRTVVDPGDAHRTGRHTDMVVDYVIEAHTGELLAELPRTPDMADPAAGLVETSATDALGTTRKIRITPHAAGSHLIDSTLNVHTYDLGGNDIGSVPLPGEYVADPPAFGPDAVSAHANAAAVADFLRSVLRRNGIDGQGGRLVSSVNCIVRRESQDGKEWRNAAWYRNQMVYGQRWVGGKLRTYAAGLDVVGHECFHGVTSATARLEYLFESGALNESYSDIFGVIVSNQGRDDITTWDWRLGEDTQGDGVPLRDLSDPAAHGQPAHMDEYLMWTADKDNGAVHYNSGIHNRAAHLVLTARDAAGKPVFTPTQAAALFYLALTQHLSRTSGFSDSRRAVTLVARTLFRNAPADVREAKLTAVAAGFDRVGIT